MNNAKFIGQFNFKNYKDYDVIAELNGKFYDVQIVDFVEKDKYPIKAILPKFLNDKPMKRKYKLDGKGRMEQLYLKSKD